MNTTDSSQFGGSVSPAANKELAGVRSETRNYKLTILLGTLALILAVALAGCNRKPSHREVELAIRNMLPDKVPGEILERYMLPDKVPGEILERSEWSWQCTERGLHSVEVKEIRVLEVGESWRNPPHFPTTSCMVKVWLDGTCVTEHGERVPFRGEINWSLLYGDGRWDASY